MNNLGRGSENNQRNKDRIFTRETAGIVLVLFAAIALVILITRDVVFGNVGFSISAFLLGTFGYCAYVVLAALIFAGIVLITGKKPSVPGKIVGLCILLFVFLVCLVHTITAAAIGIPYNGYGGYLSDCYAAGASGGEGNPWPAPTAGGAVFGLIVYPVAKLTTPIGGYIIFSLLIAGSAYLIYAVGRGGFPARRKTRGQAENSGAVNAASADTSGLYDLNYAAPSQQYADAQPPYAGQYDGAQQQYPQQDMPQAYAENNVDRSKRLYELGEDFGFKSRREMRQDRRAEEARRAQEPLPPVSPYAQGRSILYPDRGQDGEYNWYNERFGGGSSAPAPRVSSSSSNDAPYSSYTSNRIFDKDSYFNRPRHAISKEQYGECFRGPTSYSEGHERTSPRKPAPEPAQPEPKASETGPSETKPAEPKAPTYSEFYADGAESNITYSDRPKKILADTPRPAEEHKKEDYYRNDVQPETPRETFSSFREEPPAPRPEAPSSVHRETPPVHETPAARAESVDVDDIARRVGFGALHENERERPESGRDSARPVRGTEPPARGAEPPVRGAEPPVRGAESPVRGAEPPVRGAEPPVRGAEPPVPSVPEDRRAPENTGRGTERGPLPSREEDRFARGEGEDRFSSRRSLPESEEEEEQTGLRPIDSAVDIFDGDDDEEPVGESAVPEAIERAARTPSPREVSRERTPVPEPAPEAPRKKHIYARYNAPSLNLLRDYPNYAGSLNTEEVERNQEIIVETLAALKVPCEVEKITRGPSVTRYEINIPGNIPTARVLGCSNELAMRLHAKDGINVQINYESGLISIEVPNSQKETVGLKDLLLSPEFANAKPGSLAFGIGKDIEGRPVCGDIVKMTHLLVAGATNSGKSVCLHALIVSLLFRYSPEELRIILVDPKQVEFNVYDKLPHLMINEIVNDSAKVINMLNWAITEMERRYSLFKEKTKKGTLVREVNEYNANLTPEEEMLPKIVIIIDELADLMSVAKKDIEDRIQRLTQKSRAAGIHLVLATQRPSVNVITGVIKSNLPTRIALKVTQEVDSRTILDESGAENLLGQGDLLYRTASMTFPRRVQGAYVTNAEIQAVVDYVKEHNEAYFDDSVSDYINNERSGAGESGDDDDSVEPVYIDALRYVVSIGTASISMIQRKCSVGYPKAGKIIEWMENMGYISAFEGAKSRKVLLTQEEFDAKYGDYGE